MSKRIVVDPITRIEGHLRIDVEVDGDGLKATARGEEVDHDRHELDMEVKAITYHGLKVEREGDGWLAEVIVDL